MTFAVKVCIHWWELPLVLSVLGVSTKELTIMHVKVVRWDGHNQALHKVIATCVTPVKVR